MIFDSMIIFFVITDVTRQCIIIPCLGMNIQIFAQVNFMQNFDSVACAKLMRKIINSNYSKILQHSEWNQ